MAKKGNLKKCKNWSRLGFFVADRYGLDEKNIWSRREWHQQISLDEVDFPEEQHILVKTSRLLEEAGSVGVMINARKAKITRINAKSYGTIKVEEEEGVDEFIYSGSTVSEREEVWKTWRIEFRKQGVPSSILRRSGRAITSQGEQSCDRTKRQSCYAVRNSEDEQRRHQSGRM